MTAPRCLPVWLLAALCACEGEQRSWGFVVGESTGVTLVTEGADQSDMTWNATAGTGIFFIQNGCLQVRESSAVWTPVLPAGTSISADRQALVVGGTRLELGRTHDLTYPADLPADAAATIRLPERCAQRLLRLAGAH